MKTKQQKKQISVIAMLTIALSLSYSLAIAQPFAWAKRMGGAGSDGSIGVSTDAQGNVYNVGYFRSNVDFGNGNSLTSAGSTDIYVQKLDPDGNLLWLKQFGSTLDDGASVLVSDDAGYVYVQGNFSGTVDFDPSANTVNLTALNADDAFILKLDTDGNFQWVVNAGSTDEQDYGAQLVVKGAYLYSQVSLKSGREIGITKRNRVTGAEEWSKVYGGTVGTQALIPTGLDVDTNGNLFLTGLFSQAIDLDPSAATLTKTPLGSSDFFVLQLNEEGSLVWAKTIGGTSDDASAGVELDGQGNVYIVGYFKGTVDFNPNPDLVNNISSKNGTVDSFILKLDTNGIFVWATNDVASDAENEYSPGCLQIGADGTIYSVINFSSQFKLNTHSANDGHVVSTTSFVIDSDSRYVRTFFVDDDGDIFLTGSFNGTMDFNPYSGVYILSSSYTVDGFIVALKKSLSTISNFADLTKTINGGPFELTAGSTSSGAISYSVVPTPGYTGQVTLSGTGNKTVTPTQAGQVKIRATAAADAAHKITIKDITLTLIKDMPSITFINRTKTIGGAPFDLNASAYAGATFTYSIVNDGTNTGVITLSGTGNKTVTLQQAGTVKIKASLAETAAFTAAEKVITLTINATKSDPQITFDDFTKTYGDDDFTLSASAYEGAVFTYSKVNNPLNTANVTLSGTGGKTVTIVQAGVIKLKASLAETDDYTAAEKIITLTITKAAANVNISIPAATYDGSAKSVGVTTTPTGLPVIITYNGSATAPSNAATYEVVARINDVNFEGTKTGTLTINKAQTQVTFSNITKTFGDVFTLEASSNPSSAITYEVVPGGTGAVQLNNGSVTITKAGTVTLRAKVAESTNYLAASKDATLTINKKAQSINFDTLPNKLETAAPFDLSASATSGLAVSFSVVSGPATVQGNKVTLTKALGVVTIKAEQAGNENYLAAPSVERSFTVSQDVIAGLEGRSDTHVSLFPVPSRDRVTVKSTGLLIKGIRSFDLTGRQVEEVLPEHAGASVDMNVSGYAAGIYLLHIELESGQRTLGKILVER